MDPGGDSSICTACALCCNGALFDWTPAGRDEAGFSAFADMIEDDPANGSVCRQPCGRLAGTRCTIYPARPRTCRAYRCELLKRLERAEIDRQSALATIVEARRLLARVAAQLAPGQSMSDARRAWSRSEQQGALDALPPAVSVRLFALNLFLDRHFRRPDQKQVIMG